MTVLQKNLQIETFSGYMNQLFEDASIDLDDNWWETEECRKELSALVDMEKNYISDSSKMNIDVSEKYIFASCGQADSSFIQAVTAQAVNLVQSETEPFSKLHLVFFAQDIRALVYLEETFDRKKRERLRAELRKAASWKKRSLSVDCIYILNQEYYKKSDIKLHDLQRYEMLQIPQISYDINRETKHASGEKNSALQALMFTVKLRQLVEVYTQTGDQLFRNNVRYGVGESLGVDQSIRETLEREPELFWYKNNGVTILVEEDKFNLKSAGELFLGHIEPGEKPTCSVVNGAQTIIASTRYYYGLKQKMDAEADRAKKREYEQALDRFENAYVTLRVIQIRPDAGQSAEEAKKLLQSISVSLNRQKPIKVEDIAFSNPYVEKLANYLLNRDAEEPYYLVRRGEKSPGTPQIDLIEFLRARKACAGAPGSARGQGASTLLKIKPGTDDQFQDEKIFVDEWLDSADSQEDMVFQKYYGSTWFAHQTALEYERRKSGVLSSCSGLPDQVMSVIRNGKWYFTAFLVQFYTDPTFAHADEPDFSDFHISFKEIQSKIQRAIQPFAQLIAKFADNVQWPGLLDSNCFKKDALYKALIETAKKGELPGKEFQALQVELGIQPLQKINDAAKKFVKVILDNQEYLASSNAEAMGHTVRYILNHCDSNAKDVIVQSCGSWLTDDLQAVSSKSGFFSTLPRRLETKMGVFWLGTHSSNERKYAQLSQLCRLTDMPVGTILWWGSSQDQPVFSW